MARLLLRSAGWLLLAAGAGFVAGFLLGFAAGLIDGLQHGPTPVSRGLVAAIGPVSALALQATLLLGARHGSRAPPGAGLDAGPVRRRGLLLVLLVGQLVATWTWTVLVAHQFGAPGTTVAGMVQRSVTSGAWLLGIVVVLTVLVAPVCEELFFRGWMWSGLRRTRGPVTTALLTAVPWLLLHLADGGWRRVLILVPAAILFSVGRHLCGGVRASMIMHISNNGSVAALIALVVYRGS